MNPCSSSSGIGFSGGPVSGGCGVGAPVGAEGVVGSSITGDTKVPVPVPGMSVTFTSLTPERLAIDASAFFEFGPTGGAPYSIQFDVLLDGVIVASFGVDEDSDFVERFSASTSLLVPVAAGPHTVLVQWSSPNVGTDVDQTTTLLDGNLRVLRFAC